jgi:glycosyltransferase involved in cell wall biosynthesis
MLPIGVVIPTRNSAALVPDHLETMRQWLDQVQEVVVVDSFSNDGTVDLLKTGLRHPNLRFLDHPPGLYQSWNYGIAQIKADYCYVSTVGDAITREGLEHLAEVIARLHCDVAISKPGFINVGGNPIPSPRWPIDDVTSTLHVKAPISLSGLGLFLFTLVNYRDAILGSSASNLYRTRCVQENPFPVGYGTAGDGGWGLENCFKVRIAVTPRVFSNIREHPKSYSKAEYAVDQMSRKMLDQICRTYREATAASAEFEQAAKDLHVERMIELIEQQLACQQRLEEYRRRSIWVFFPGAWRARFARNARARELNQLKEAGVRRVCI